MTDQAKENETRDSEILMGEPASEDHPERTPTVGSILNLRNQVWVSQTGPKIPILLTLHGKDRIKRNILRKKENVIGRNPKTDVFVSDYRVSRRHAVIRWENMDRKDEYPRCVLEDLDSRNGVFLNRRRVRRVALSDGDRILMGSTVMGFFIKDLMELDYEEKLRSQAVMDSLTLLANRPSFEEAVLRNVKLAERYKRPLTFCLMDLDEFRSLNKNYGHAVGDEILMHVAGLLLGCLRKSDVVGRLGGDEFGVLLPQTDIRQAALVVNKILNLVADSPYHDVTGRIPLSLSAGVVSLTPDMTDWMSVYKKADKALFQAKKRGGNGFFSEDPDEKSKDAEKEKPAVDQDAAKD